MFIAGVKNRNWRQKIFVFASGIGTAMIFLGSSVIFLQQSNSSWKTYKNSRYDFEFPRPSNWNTLNTPENADGVALVSPENNHVQIRSWASKILPGFTSVTEQLPEKIKPNFQTNQGVYGVLVVEVGQKSTVINLTIVKDDVKYYWQGQSKNQDFPKYYPLFYYMAQEYKISH
ncbi:MAG TPA: hypothetical protein VK184_09455 [Nostocaceae cyanobacterium]|nr:hypothetical protein [Nostocaceae cyanobacterium]